MMKLTLVIAAVAVVALVAGGVFLATWNIPAPSVQVEKTVPDDRFPR